MPSIFDPRTVALAVWFLLGSCSMHTFPRVDCVDDDDCETLGLGLGCNSETGLCTEQCSSDAQCLGDAYYGRLCATDATCQSPAAQSRCSRTFPEDLYDRPEDFRLIVATLFDPSQPTHVARERSARLAVRQANDNGGLDDGLVGMIQCSLQTGLPDGLSRREAAVANAVWLRNAWGVSAVIGPASSGDTQAVFEAIGDNTFVISPSATSPTLTTIDNTEASDANPGLLWRTAPPDSFQGQIIAADLNTRRIRRISVIAEMGAYGEGLVGVFSDAYSGEFELLLFEEGNNSQRDEQVTEASANEVLFISSQTADLVAFVRIAATPQFDDRSIFLTDTAATAEVTEAVRSNLHGRIRGTRPAPISNLVYDNFSASYAATYGGVDVSQFTFTAHSLDAAWVALYGAAWAVARGQPATGRSIAQGVRHLSEGTPLPLIGSSWPTAQNAFRNGRDVNVSGASGALDFDPTTEEIAAPVEVWTINTCGEENIIESLPLAGIIRPCD